MTKAGDFVRTKRGELNFIVGPDGEKLRLGLRAPTRGEPKRVFARVSAVYPLLDEKEIRRRLDARTRAREIWGPEFIKNQNGIGACQGYASAGALEKARMLGGQKHVPLSGDYAYALVNGGVDRGSALSAGLKAAQEQGYCPESKTGVSKWTYRYRQFPQSARDAAGGFKGFDGVIAKTEQEMMTCIAYGWPGVVAVQAGRGFTSLDKHGISKGGNGRGNHAVQADDAVYDTRAGIWKIDEPNSWKTSFGEEGRCYLTFQQHLRVTIKYHTFCFFPWATLDPDGDNPPPLEMA